MLSGDRDETVNHISECDKLVQKSTIQSMEGWER